MQKVLRPLSFGDLFDEVFDLYKRNFLLLAGIASVVYIPMAVIQIAAMLLVINPMQKINTSPNAPPHMPSAPTFAMIGALAVLMIILIPLAILMQGAITRAISSCYIDRKPTILETYKSVSPKILPIAGTSLITGAICLAALILCCLPIIPAAIFLAFVPQVVILEDISYVEAIKRSYQLALYDWPRVFAVLILSMVLTWICSCVASLPFTIIQFTRMAAGNMQPSALDQVLQTCSQSLVYAVVQPVALATMVLLYYDIRVRKEGFDIQLLAHSLGHSNGSNGASSVPNVEEQQP